MGKTIGIDLGTTNSCVAVMEGDRCVMIPNEKGGRTTPSVVAFTKSGERLVGEAAVRQSAVNPLRTVKSVKRYMGSDWHIDIDSVSFTPQEISAMILRKLKNDAEIFLGEPVTDAVITVPAYFNDIQRRATKDAGRIAGLNVKRIINEPTGAALAYGLGNGEAKKIMVYDLGGGTFDVSVIEIGEGVIEVLATNGDNHLGGDDFDERLADFLALQIKKSYRYDIRKDPAAYMRLKEASEEAKKELSSVNVTTVTLPYLFMNDKEPVNFEYTITRETFIDLIKDLINKTETPVRNALNDAGIAPSELDMVLLVGGSTRIPAISDKVYALTGLAPSKSINPDECVAQGAAIQGEILEGSLNTLPGTFGGLLLLDVIPMSLSIETVGGIATRLVERNSTLPIHYSQVFSTAAPFQKDVEIHVLQGERPMARDNRTIGKFKLTGIKRAPAGVPKIDVTFDIDTNGILKVSAKDLDTGMEQSIVITADQRMSEEEIEAAIKDAREYEREDRLRREAIEVINDGTRVLARVEQALAESGHCLSKDDKKLIKADCNLLKDALSKAAPEAMTEVLIRDIRTAIRKIESDSANLCWDCGKNAEKSVKD